MDLPSPPPHPRAGSITNLYLTSDDGSVRVPAFYLHEKEGFHEIKSAMDCYKWNDEDFLLATYPKNGTHFMWEIMTMLVRGTADYINKSKGVCMIDLFPVTKAVEMFPSPRVLNTHYRLDVLPPQFRDKKTVVVMRNPKDTCVSFFYHQSKMDTKIAEGRIGKPGAAAEIEQMKHMTLSNFVKMFLFNKDVPLGSYFDYVEYMWSLRDNSNILIVFFEDLKKDPVSVIEKVNRFMGTERSAELVEQIAEATRFSKMKQGKKGSHDSEELLKKVETTKELAREMIEQLYRKGEIGDWRAQFTSDDNQLFDAVLDKWAVGKEIPFQYE